MNTPASPTTVAPRHVAAGNGLRWWGDSFSWLFGDMARLGVWVGMWLCFVLVQLPLHLFPFAGALVSFLLLFVLCGGLMNAARKTEAGQAPVFADLFGGFGPQGGALVGAALLVLAACALVLGLMLLIGVGALISAVAGYVSWRSFDWYEPALRLRLGAGSVILMLGCLALLVPISMAAWLAPALVVLRGASPVDALRLSLAACWRNVGALTVYGIAFIGLALASTMMLLLGWLFLGPLMFLSTYAAFRDMFSAPPPAAPGSA